MCVASKILNRLMPLSSIDLSDRSRHLSNMKFGKAVSLGCLKKVAPPIKATIKTPIKTPVLKRASWRHLPHVTPLGHSAALCDPDTLECTCPGREAIHAMHESHTESTGLPPLLTATAWGMHQLLEAVAEETCRPILILGWGQGAKQTLLPYCIGRWAAQTVSWDQWVFQLTLLPNPTPAAMEPDKEIYINFS